MDIHKKLQQCWFFWGIRDEEHRTSISRIEIEEGNTVRVVDGPLRGYLGNVVKVNLHKREAVVRVEFMGRDLELKMGVDMVCDK